MMSVLLMLSVRFELTSLAAAVFETAVYTIPPQEQMMPVNVDGFSHTTGIKARMGSEGLEPPALAV